MRTGTMAKRAMEIHESVTPFFVICAAINPCRDEIHSCHADAKCVFTKPGQHNCTCALGYKGDGTVCVGMFKEILTALIGRQKMKHYHRNTAFY